MLAEVPEILILITGSAFLLGWLLAKVGSTLGSRKRSARRDPRDDRIRSLEAELRVAQTGGEKLKEKLEERERELAEVRRTVTVRDQAGTEQDKLILKLRQDLKDSVKKTRELRADLTERAAESVRYEVRVRELETELSVARSSTDLVASSFLEEDSATSEAAGRAVR